MRNDEEKHYLVIVKYGGEEPVINRIRESAPQIKQTIERISAGNCKLAFTSEGGDLFGYFVKTKSRAGVIKAALDGETRSTDISSLRNDDSVLVLELGQDFNARGFSNVWGWLQCNVA